MSGKRKFLVYFYKDNFTIRWYNYVYAADIDAAWLMTESLYGKGNIESISLEPKN